MPVTSSRIAGAALRQSLATDMQHQSFLLLCTYPAAAAAQAACDWKLLLPESLHLQAPTYLLLVLLEASKSQT